MAPTAARSSCGTEKRQVSQVFVVTALGNPRGTVHILKAIHQTMSINGPSLRKISDTHFHSGWPSALKRPAEVVMTAILIVEDDVLANEYLEFILR